MLINGRYEVRDVWLGLHLAFKNFALLSFLGFILSIVVLFVMGGLASAGNHIQPQALMMLAVGYGVFVLIVFVQSVFIYFANRGYVIDLGLGEIRFPRSDVENSVLGIILLFPYWNLVRTMTIRASEIENIYIDTIRVRSRETGRYFYPATARYRLNISGTFGSANLPFTERQKRDEVRNAIQQCVKKWVGVNVDRKVAEFGG